MKEQDERELESKILNSLNYTTKEKVLTQEVCDTVNADETLKRMFIKSAGRILSEFMIAETKAFRMADIKEGDRVMRRAVSHLRGLAMHVCVKVITKREAK